MKNILVVSGHTDLNSSIANRTILEKLQEDLPQAKFVFLDKSYPDFQINREVEQHNLLNADIIVFQFPLFWYSVPSIMKRWIEEVFVYGFSHGLNGDKLRNKKLVISFTSGASKEMYQHGALQNYTIDEFLIPLEQLANLCGMEWCGYVYSDGLSYTDRNTEFLIPLEQLPNSGSTEWSGYAYSGRLSDEDGGDGIKLKQIYNKAIKHESRLLEYINSL